MFVEEWPGARSQRQPNGCPCLSMVLQKPLASLTLRMGEVDTAHLPILINAEPLLDQRIFSQKTLKMVSLEAYYPTNSAAPLAALRSIENYQPCSDAHLNINFTTRVPRLWDPIGPPSESPSCFPSITSASYRACGNTLLYTVRCLPNVVALDFCCLLVDGPGAIPILPTTLLQLTSLRLSVQSRGFRDLDINHLKAVGQIDAPQLVMVTVRWDINHPELLAAFVEGLERIISSATRLRCLKIIDGRPESDRVFMDISRPFYDMLGRLGLPPSEVVSFGLDQAKPMAKGGFEDDDSDEWEEAI
ncbi:hypothetical protein VNI00_014731 [Paramarasmius palmivorus]|uniref:Uncharacterized protein n=1 Tax=Paramarasmius palmivorus TaxID=297713 RepID=A0AAW0BQQ6_9AGAR